MRSYEEDDAVTPSSRRGRPGGSSQAGPAWPGTRWRSYARWGATLLAISAFGLLSSSRAGADEGTVSDLEIVAVASPSPTDSLFPGGRGDVVVSITNPNPFPVTMMAVDLPSDGVYADGFTDSDLGSAQPGCDSTSSLVTWSRTTGVDGSQHSLAIPINVAAGDTLAVTLTDEATMGVAAPAACEGAFMRMPALTGVVAVAGSGSSPSGPDADHWGATDPGPAPTPTTVVPEPTPTTVVPSQPTPPAPVVAVPTSTTVGQHAPPAAVTHGSGPVPPVGDAVTPIPSRHPEAPKGTADAPANAVPTIGPRPSPWLHHLVTTALRSGLAVGAATAISFVLLPFIVAFLILQRRLDANDPKLALAPLHNSPEREFRDLEDGDPE